jgi:hypothetical protein
MRIHQYGDASVIRQEDVPRPVPADLASVHRDAESGRTRGKITLVP